MPEIKLTLSKKTIADLDEFAEAAEVTRSETIRDLLAYAFDAIEDDPQFAQPEEDGPETDEPAEDGGDDIAPEDVLVDSEGVSYFIDRARPLKDGTMAVKLIPLEEADLETEGDESPPSDDDLDSEEPEAD
jgi:hypothetical protein